MHATVEYSLVSTYNVHTPIGEYNLKCIDN